MGEVLKIMLAWDAVRNTPADVMSADKHIVGSDSEAVEKVAGWSKRVNLHAYLLRLAISLCVGINGHAVLAVENKDITAVPAPNLDSTYSIHALLRVMNPVDISAMNDGRQIATAVRSVAEYTEIDCTLFPFIASVVKADAHWRQDDVGLADYVRPGATANWNSQMQKDLVAALKADHIDVEKLDDKTLVEQVSRWLLKRTHYRPMFDTWYEAFPDGTPHILLELVNAFHRKDAMGDPSWTDQQQFEHEILGNSMYYNGCSGSCTSYAIYQATALRALGIPTRIFVTIPVADASDKIQMKMIGDSIHQHLVRMRILEALKSVGNSFANHTYNEVYVGGQWIPLNYSCLGQPMLDSNYYGLMVHVNTLNDWADSTYATTWGKRYGLEMRSPALPGANPYKTLEISDKFGAHSAISPVDGIPKEVAVSKVYWQSDPQRPAGIWDEENDGKGHLLLHVATPEMHDYVLLKAFMHEAERDFILQSPGCDPVTATINFANVTGDPDRREVFLSIVKAQYASMAIGRAYTVTAPAAKNGFTWTIAVPLQIVKTR